MPREMTGEQREEWISMLDLIAQHQEGFQQHEAAEETQQKIIQLAERDVPDERQHQIDAYQELGIAASKRHQWEQAENYHQRALQILVELNDRYAQAFTYHQLGKIARERNQWEQAEAGFLEAFSIFVKYADAQNSRVTSANLARIWRERKGTELIRQMASILNCTPEEIEELFRNSGESELDQSERTPDTGNP